MAIVEESGSWFGFTGAHGTSSDGFSGLSYLWNSVDNRALVSNTVAMLSFKIMHVKSRKQYSE